MAQYIVFHERETPGGPLRHLAGTFETLGAAAKSRNALTANRTGDGFYYVVGADEAASLHIKS